MAKKQDFDFIPSSYEELYTHYVAKKNGVSIVRTLIRSKLPHATEEEMETLTQDVFLRCMDKKVIAGFDPTKANFGGVIYFVTRSICANYLDRKSRDPMTGLHGGSLTEEEQEDEGFTPGVWNLDRFMVPFPDTAQRYEAHEQVKWLVGFAERAAANPKNKRDQCLLGLIGMLLEESTPQEIAEELEVTVTTVSNWVKYLAETLRAHAA